MFEGETRGMGEGCALAVACHDDGGGNPAVEQKGKPMTFADLCLLLGLMIAFATLVVKVIEVVARKD